MLGIYRTFCARIGYPSLCACAISTPAIWCPRSRVHNSRPFEPWILRWPSRRSSRTSTSWGSTRVRHRHRRRRRRVTRLRHRTRRRWTSSSCRRTSISTSSRLRIWRWTRRSTRRSWITSARSETGSCRWYQRWWQFRFLSVFIFWLPIRTSYISFELSFCLP